MNTDQARSTLQERLSTLEAQIAQFERELPTDTDDLSHIHQHPGDQATGLVEVDREHGLIENSEREREAVLAALARIEDGSFGRCVDCGKEIPDERLEARPDASRCIEDQSKFERLSD